MLEWLVNHIIKLLLHILLKIDAKELDKLPHEGPLIVVANHINFLEIPVVITEAYPRPTTGFVKQEAYNNLLHHFLFTVWGGIPIERDSADFEAFKQAEKALKAGKILAVAPEGTRTEDGRMIRGKPGIGILISRCDVPIIPMAYYGHEEFSKNLKRLKRTPMKLKVGKPFKVRFGDQPKSKALMQDVADAIMLEIAKLLPEKYHGVYADIEVDQERYIDYQ